MSVYLPEACQYTTDKGYGPFFVALPEMMSGIQHLMHPMLAPLGHRLAVCDQKTELNWAHFYVEKLGPPPPICGNCINTVESLQ